jgi:hypothetical protein
MTAIELIARLTRVSQRLQQLQERHGAQLSRADQVWVSCARQYVEYACGLASSGLHDHSARRRGSGELVMHREIMEHRPLERASCTCVSVMPVRRALGIMASRRVFTLHRR